MAGEALIRTARQAKIVGGSFASKGEFPHQVYLSYNDEFLCGGSILSTLLILTAAHCVKYKRPNRLKITAGAHDTTHISSGSEQIRTARYIYMHENYVWETDINDIALIVLNSPLQYTSHVRNISLPKNGEEFDGFAVVSGWGRTKEKGDVSAILKKVKLPIVPNWDCRRRYRKVKMKVTEHMICAGESGRDACQGDSGGPAVCNRTTGNNSISFQCGIVSHGYGCGRVGYPGILTKLSNYIDWIEKTRRKIIGRGKCRTDHYYCTPSGASEPGCIPRTFLCDLESDCKGGEDENGCIYMTSCRMSSEFRCNNGRCIKKEYTCDEMDDCGDRSDEDKCPTENKICEGGQHQCGVGGRCIPEEWICDKNQDCDDNSDETDCPGGVSSSENEIDDRENKTSITTTPSPCASNQFYCSRDFRCIPLAFRCDMDRDCRSGMDELGCSSDNDGDNNRSTTTTTSLHIPTASPEENLGMTSTSFNINATTTSPDIISTSPHTNFSIGPCSRSQFFCDNGQCISNVFQCDFENDCEDGSDEKNCELESTCTPYFWQCGNKQCIYHRFICDGDSDCADGTDEVDCNEESNTINRRRRRKGKSG